MKLRVAILAVALASTVPCDARAQHFTDRDTLAPVFPTPETVVDLMLTMAQIKPGETVYDLGCGDGRIVIAAAQKFKARAVGIEIRRDVFERTAARVAALGLSDQVKIVRGNALKYDLSSADVVTLYLMTRWKRAPETHPPEGPEAFRARRLARLREIRGMEAGRPSIGAYGGRPAPYGLSLPRQRRKVTTISDARIVSA